MVHLFGSTSRTQGPYRVRLREQTGMVPVVVGAGGFEPPTSRTRTVRSIRAEPRPVTGSILPYTALYGKEDALVHIKYYWNTIVRSN